MFHCFNLHAYIIGFFVKVSIETNVNISHELTFSCIYGNVNYIWSLEKLI